MSDTRSPDNKERPLPAAWGKNPYQAPTAQVKDVKKASVDDTLADDPNKVAFGRGAAWWSESWHLFREATGLWIGIGFVFSVLYLGIGLIPIVGTLASSLLFPVFGAGLMLGCHSLDSDGELSFGHLFAGFQNNPGRLLMIGLLYLLGLVAIFLIVFFALGLGGIFDASVAEVENATQLGMLLGFLVGLLLGTPLVMSVWFAPALAALHDLTAFEAMKLSFRGCLRNLLPLLLYGLVFFVLAVLATLPLMLGWLLFTPVFICSIYVGYREIFTNGR